MCSDCPFGIHPFFGAWLELEAESELQSCAWGAEAVGGSSMAQEDKYEMQGRVRGAKVGIHVIDTVECWDT